MFVVLTYTSDFIVYFVRALRDALSKKKNTWKFAKNKCSCVDFRTT